MIIILGGIPTSGKTSIVRSILGQWGSYEACEPLPLFACQKYGDILVVGKYKTGEKFCGTDRLSYGTISKFRDFIDQEAPKHKHIFLEGDRFFRAKDLEWLLDNHDAKVYILTVSAEEEKRRHIQRQDTQTEKWLQGRHTQISHILTNFMLMNNIDVRSNENENDSENIKKEIMELLNG